jgi:glyoxylase-like metal-dependent hydrolase (beta-lactamase superfamily II)
VTRGPLTVYTFQRDSANVHLVVEGEALLLVDSGYETNAKELERDIRRAGFEPSRIRALVLTHGHADHAGGARYFHEHFHIPVIAGSGDRAMLGAGRNETLCSTGLLGDLRHSTDQNAKFSSTSADVWVSAPAPLAPLTGIEGSIVPMPGHTRGSLVVVIGDIALVGDLFRGSLLGSGAATHLYMCDLDANRRDVARLLGHVAPRARLFFVGHFGPAPRGAVASHFEVRARSERLVARP